MSDEKKGKIVVGKNIIILQKIQKEKGNKPLKYSVGVICSPGSRRTQKA
jgi:hypothetical protein